MDYIGTIVCSDCYGKIFFCERYSLVRPELPDYGVVEFGGVVMWTAPFM